MTKASDCVKSLVCASFLATIGTASLAATCDQTQTITVPWTIDISPNQPTGTAAGQVNTVVVAGSASASTDYTVSLLHNAPPTICNGPIPALPTSADITAMIEWAGFLGRLSTASGATASLELSINGQPIVLPDNVLSDETNLTRFFLETLDHHFSVTLDSTFSVNGTMSLSDIVKDNFFEFSLVAQGFRVTLSPDVISGVVQYAVPVPLPATLGMGLAGLAVLGGAAATRRKTARTTT